MQRYKEYIYLQREMNNKIKGGLADNKNINSIAKHHNVSIEHLKNQLSKGIKVELEHTSDKATAKEIAYDHLWENPNYYTELQKIEEQLESKSLYDVDVDTIFNYIEEIMSNANYEEASYKGVNTKNIKQRNYISSDNYYRPNRDYTDSSVDTHYNDHVSVIVRYIPSRDGFVISFNFPQREAIVSPTLTNLNQIIGWIYSREDEIMDSL